MDNPIDLARARVAALFGKAAQQAEGSQPALSATFEAISEILVELEITEEELRQQNEELALARAHIELERQRYQSLFEFAPDAYLVTDPKGIIQEANRAAAELLNVRQEYLIGKPLILFIEDDDHALFQGLLSKLEQTHNVEMQIRPRGDSPHDAAITMGAMFEKDGNPSLVRWLVRDVTLRKQAALALDASERRFRAIFNEASLGIILVDLQGRIVRSNRAFQQLLGYSEEALYGLRVSDLGFPEDAAFSDEITRELREGQQSEFQLEKCYRHQNGESVWTSTTISLLRSDTGQPQFTIEMAKDITAEKQAAEDLEEMRSRLLDAGEVERLNLAQELHDGPMQDLYGAIFQLSGILQPDTDPAIVKSINEVQEMLRKVSGTLRVICGDLRPPTIANLGLERAIRSHVERIQDQHPELEIRLQLTYDGQDLPNHSRMAFFRIYQQCMANVLRHAQATQVVIAFHLDEREITLDVWDNGKGFTLPPRWVDLLREGHYGLAGIAERIDALGGSIKVDSKPGAGTMVHVVAPRE